jgi:hypothetical protein
MQPLSIAIISVVGFYTISALYRAFKIRTLDSLAFISVAVITMLSNAPLAMQIWPGFATLRIWIDKVPVASAMRAVLIVTFVGILAVAVRGLLGYEKTTTGGQ